MLVGRLWVRVRGDRESASFEYDRSWLSRPDCYSLEPALASGPGAFHTRKALFGAIGDSAPDRWGRVLATNIDEFDGTASLDVALATARYYGLGQRDAGRIAGEVGAAVTDWREVAAGMGATGRESDRMESAFSHEDLEGALALG